MNKAAEHARNGWRHGMTIENRDAIDLSIGAMLVILLYGAGVAVIAATMWFLSVAMFRGEPANALETITRYEMVINGERVQCERREDHVRGTTEVAC